MKRSIIRLLDAIGVGQPLRRLVGRAHPLVDVANEDKVAVDFFCRQLGEDVCYVDVGANLGQVIGAVLQRKPKAAVYAFEAIPELCTQLKAKYPAAIVHNTAVADFAGESTFSHVVSNPGFSGLKQRLDLPSSAVTKTIRVPCVRLDDALVTIEKIDLMKIDVEGAEILVLKGADGLLTRHRPFLVFEHGQGGASEYGCQPQELYDYLTARGYQLQTLPSIEKLPQGLSGQQFVEEFNRGRHYVFAGMYRSNDP